MIRNLISKRSIPTANVRSFAAAPLTSAPSPEKAEIASLVARSRAAQAQIENYTQEQVDQLCKVGKKYSYKWLMI